MKIICQNVYNPNPPSEFMVISALDGEKVEILEAWAASESKRPKQYIFNFTNFFFLRADKLETLWEIEL